MTVVVRFVAAVCFVAGGICLVGDVWVRVEGMGVVLRVEVAGMRGIVSIDAVLFRLFYYFCRFD